jgi:aspartate/methionine/tyrosine aminotransferase
MNIASAISRLGTESAFEVLAKAQSLEQKGMDVINLGIGAPDFKTPENIVEAGCKAIKDGYHFYTPAKGIIPLRETVARNIKKYRNVEVNPDNIIIVPGGKPTMFFATLIFGEPGAEIMYPDPGFPIYRSMIEFTGAKAIPIKLSQESGFSFSAQPILDNITPKTRLIIINSPANPTGGVVSSDELDKLADGLEKHPNVFILSDEIYSRIIYDNKKFETFLKYEHLRDRIILLDGWSKTYSMTGWRLGYGIWPDCLVEIAERLQINSNSCASAPVQMAGIEALNGPQDSVDMMVKAFNERRKIIVRELNKIKGFNCIEPKGAFYAFPNITNTGYNSKELEEIILNKTGVATIAGTSFGTYGEGFLRFSYAANTERILEALNRIKKLIG